MALAVQIGVVAEMPDGGEIMRQIPQQVRAGRDGHRGGEDQKRCQGDICIAAPPLPPAEQANPDKAIDGGIFAKQRNAERATGKCHGPPHGDTAGHPTDQRQQTKRPEQK